MKKDDDHTTETPRGKKQRSGASNYREAVARYRDPAKRARILTARDRNDAEFGAWRCTVEIAPQSAFADRIDFFVNLPSLADTPDDHPTSKAWKRPWREASTLQDEFATTPVVVRLMRELGIADSLLESGWWLRDDSGRIDAETTWSDCSFLVSTERHFAYIQLYQVIDH
jgi:hypothetical protein